MFDSFNPNIITSVTIYLKPVYDSSLLLECWLNFWKHLNLITEYGTWDQQTTILLFIDYSESRKSSVLYAPVYTW